MFANQEWDGELWIDFDGVPARASFHDSTFELHLNRVRSALALMRQLSPAELRSRLQQAARVLNQANITGRILVQGWTVAQMSPSIKPGWIARLLGLDPFSLNIGALIMAALGRKNRSSTRRTPITEPPQPELLDGE